MKKIRSALRKSALLGLAACALAVPSVTASGVVILCLPGVNDIEITLLDEAVDYGDYVSPTGGGLPALPDIEANDNARAEFAYVSESLATELELGTVAADWRGPNPQIRVRIAVPSAYLNYWEMEDGFPISRWREGSAVFTVIGVVADEFADDLRLYVFEQEDPEDDDAGQYKLFANDYGLMDETRVRRAARTDDDNPADGRLDTPRAIAWAVAPSKSTFTPAVGSVVNSRHFCEADTDGGRLTEASIQVADNQLLIMAPHGGNIEIGTTEQAQQVVGQLDTAHGIDANYWATDGHWGDDQTSVRWHITSTSISLDGYPALASVMPATNYLGGDFPFRYVVAFHGFGAEETASCGMAGMTDYYQLIIGGEASTNDKCVVATHVRQAIDAVTGFAEDSVAIAIRLDEGEDEEEDASYQILDSCGRDVHESGKSGTSHRNVINRLSADGGIQIEQSRSLRNNDDLRDAVADGVANALADLLDGAPVNACAPFD